jgi:hypothetical protein
MKIRILIISLAFLSVLTTELYAVSVNYAIGVHLGLSPAFGGDLDSLLQEKEFHSQSGINGINKKMDGFKSTTVDRLLGMTSGGEIKTVIAEYFLVRLGGNFTFTSGGGGGRTVYNHKYIVTDPDDYRSLSCSYTFYSWDLPFTVGLSVPYWKDMKIAFSCGIAYAGGVYVNKFSTDQDAWKGKFKSWGLPMVIILEGEYFLTPQFAVNSSISYYSGSSNIVRDGSSSDGFVDYARLNFSGYRFAFGVSYYFKPI